MGSRSRFHTYQADKTNQKGFRRWFTWDIQTNRKTNREGLEEVVSLVVLVSLCLLLRGLLRLSIGFPVQNVLFV